MAASVECCHAVPRPSQHGDLFLPHPTVECSTVQQHDRGARSEVPDVEFSVRHAKLIVRAFGSDHRVPILLLGEIALSGGGDAVLSGVPAESESAASSPEDMASGTRSPPGWEAL